MPTVTVEEQTLSLTVVNETVTPVITDLPGPQGEQGIQGIQGEQGEQGEQGPAGQGIIPGGTTGQILTKASNDDYDMEWSDVTEDAYSPASLSERILDGYDRGQVNIPKGDNPITSTITLENKMGLKVIGSGNSQEIASGHSLEGSKSNIWWNTTNTTDPMFVIRGQYVNFRDMAIIGSNSAITTGGKPTAHFHISKDSDTGTGSGQHSFKHMTLVHAGAAFQFGSSRTEGNCDMTLLEDIHFRLCDKGMYVKNQQGMGYTVNHIRWTNFENLDSSPFYFEAGGDLRVFGYDILSKCTLLTLDQIYTGSNIAIGQNNAHYLFVGGKLDDNANSTCLVELKGAGKANTPAKVVFLGLHIGGNGNTWNDIFAYLGGGMDVLFSYCTINPVIDSTIQWNTTSHTGVTQLTFDNCRLPFTDPLAPLKYDTSDGVLMYRCTNNRRTNSNPINDWCGIVTGDL